MPRKRKKDRNGRKPQRKLKQVIDLKLAEALAHPFRSHILATLGDRIASPSGIAREIGVDARDLTYHFKFLVNRKIIRFVRAEQGRGGLEHFYELCLPTVYIDDPCWSQTPEQIQAGFSASLIQISMDEVIDALRAGTLNTHNSHQSRTTLIVDEQGCDEVQKMMDETLERILEIGKRCSEHRKKSSDEGIPISVFMISFETAAGAAPSGGGGASLAA